MLENYKDVLDVRDMCEILQIGQNTAYRLLKSGAVHSIRIGRKLRIPTVSLLAYLAGNSTVVTENAVSSVPSKGLKER